MRELSNFVTSCYVKIFILTSDASISVSYLGLSRVDPRYQRGSRRVTRLNFSFIS